MGSSAAGAKDAGAGSGIDAGPTIVQDIAAWDAASSQLRETIKWLASALAALGALLVGTAPFTGLANLRWPLIVAAASIAAGALAGVAHIINRLTDLLAPTPVTVRDLARDEEFADLRVAIQADPAGFLGSVGWSKDGHDLDTFLSTRQESLGAFQHLRNQARRHPTKEKREHAATALEDVRREVVTALAVTDRLLAAGRFHGLAHKFRERRAELWFMGSVVGVLIVAFLAFVQAWQPEDEAEAGPATPAVVRLTDSGATALDGLFGPTCPRTFDAMVLSGGTTGPWDITVVDEACTSGRTTLTDDQAAVLLQED